MSLKDLDDHIKSEYRSLIDNVVQDFYVPLLKEAVSYKRAVGFFSSSALIEISKGIGAMAANGGHIQIVASPYLSESDVAAINKGYAERERIIEDALLRSLSLEHRDYYSMQRLNLLAALIADGILDIRIAYTDSKNSIGMYHEKMGLIEDVEGNVIAFSGSMNESLTAMAVNYETIDVFCNWRGDSDSERVTLKQNAFYSIWNDNEPNIVVREFPSIPEAIIKRYRKCAPSFELDEEEFRQTVLSNNELKVSRVFVGARVPANIKLHPYQEEAISAWSTDNYRGIFDMATGTGKTYTGLGAISKLSEDLSDKLAVVIVCPYQHLVEQWVEDIIMFNMKPIIGYSTSAQKDWKKRLSKAVLDQKIRKDRTFFCFICTNATFTNSYVQEQISKIKTPILLVVDEAHNFGARSYAKYLDDRFTYRLALSATLDRHRDEEGTEFLYSFFGRKCIEYSLERAINEDKLTRYKYYPILVYLNEEELNEYEQLSSEISKCMTVDRNGRRVLNKYGEILALRRARLVAGAQEKLEALKIQMEPYVKDNNILVYCGATNVFNGNSDVIDIDQGEIRQIEAVTKILGNDLGMKVAKFTSQEDIETRTMIKEQFQRGDRLQAIVAIKCLDEGVNIPGIRTAFILASTTNPKEYIQRRGRVLRKAKNKIIAEIYDFVTLPRRLDSVSSLTAEKAQRDKALVMNEFLRIKEFGRLAENSMLANELMWAIKDAYNITDGVSEGEFTYE